MRLGDEFDGFSVVPERYITEGDCVVMIGRYSGTAKATGLLVNPQVVHVWTFNDGKAVSFQQHAVTLGMAVATGRVVIRTANR